MHTGKPGRCSYMQPPPVKMSQTYNSGQNLLAKIIMVKIPTITTIHSAILWILFLYICGRFCVAHSFHRLK